MEKNIKIFTKTVAVFLSLTLFIGLLPMNVFAQEVKEYLARNSISTEEEIKEARIISEIVSKRDSNTKVFLRADGSETAVISGAPLHFKDDKKWVDIDNTLKEKTVDGKSVLQNKAGAFTVSIPSDLSDNNTVSIENEGYKLSFGLQSEELENKIGSINAQVQQPRELAEAQ